MTVKEFLEEYAKRGSQMMAEIAKMCEKKCIGWTYKRMRRLNKIKKHHSLQESQDMVRDVYIQALTILFEKALRGEIKVGSAHICSYLTGICKILLYKKEGPEHDELTPFYANKFKAEESDEQEKYSPKQISLLWSCFEKLPLRQQQLILMDMEKIPHADIAEVLGYNNNSVVKATLYKARIFLTSCLGDFFNK